MISAFGSRYTKDSDLERVYGNLNAHLCKRKTFTCVQMVLKFVLETRFRGMHPYHNETRASPLIFQISRFEISRRTHTIMTHIMLMLFLDSGVCSTCAAAMQCTGVRAAMALGEGPDRDDTLPMLARAESADALSPDMEIAAIFNYRMWPRASS